VPAERPQGPSSNVRLRLFGWPPIESSRIPQVARNVSAVWEWPQAHRHRLQIERRERRLTERFALMDADGFEDGVDTDQAEAAEMLPAPGTGPDHVLVVVARFPANAAAVGVNRHVVLLLLVLDAPTLSAN
jgi:hypothetical protein